MAPLFFLEQDTGVEPAFTAWEAVVLPIYESCDCRGIITDGKGKFNHYLSNAIVRRAGLCYDKRKGGSAMREYELVREIPNLCPNNQMRDIFFDEVETDDPVRYVKDFLKGKALEISTEKQANGAVTVYALCDGMHQKFIFTPI